MKLVFFPSGIRSNLGMWSCPVNNIQSTKMFSSSSEPDHIRLPSPLTSIQVKYPNTNTWIQIHKYFSTTQIQIHRYKSTNTSHTLDDIRLVFPPTCEQINVQQKYKIQYKQNILNFFCIFVYLGYFWKISDFSKKSYVRGQGLFGRCQKKPA